jgi:hypothetical protein
MKLLQRLFAKIRALWLFQKQKMSMDLLYKTRSVQSLDDMTLMWIPGGMPLMLDVEASIAAALKLRGNKVHAIICDGVFTACVQRDALDATPMEEWSKTCEGCRKSCSRVLERMGVDYSFIGEHVSQEELANLKERADQVSWSDITTLEHEGVNVGKNVHSAVFRYLKGYDFKNDEHIVKAYAFTGLVTALAAQNAFKKFRPNRLFMSHACYADWGPALHKALALKLPVVGWMGSYLPARFYLRHIQDGVRIDMHNISSDAWQARSTTPLTHSEGAELDKYLEDRYTKDVSFDMKRFKGYAGNSDELRQKFNLDPSKPIWGVLTHINWDSVSDYSPMLYGSFNEWVIESIKLMWGMTNIQWIIKVHPAESWENNPETGVEGLIKRTYPDLPPHIRVFSAEENISPLDFFHMVDGGVTAYGTAGLEIALCGKPVILAGEAHYGAKGFTYDSHTLAQYAEFLGKAHNLGRLSVEQTSWARQYAYLYFVQRQIPLNVVKDPHSKWWRFQFNKRHLLEKGKDPAIDFICEKLVSKQEFIMDTRLLNVVNRH